MEIMEIKSSSEEDDDLYLNSVAKLKALRKQTASQTTEKKSEDKDEEKGEEVQMFNAEITEEPVVIRRSTRQIIKGDQNKSRPRTRRQNQKSVTQEQDSDLEIVSIEHPNSTENDVVITEKSVDSCEDENYDINIKILWQSKNIHRLNIRQNESFRQVFEYFSKLEQVTIDEILITKKDRIIKKSDTPASLNLSVIDILEGGIVKKDSATSQKDMEGKVDEDICIIKVQTTNKKSLTVPVRRDEDFKALLAKCAQELNTEEKKIKLYFDGELIAITDTPDSLEIEDEACFDLRMSS